MIRRGVAFAFASALVAAVAAGADVPAPDDTPAPAVVYDVRVSMLETLRPDDRIPCRNYSMNAAQVVRYFQLAEEMSGAKLHAYMYLPCEARGHLDWEGKRYEFRINLGRTAVLTGPNGRQRHFGCAHACDGLLLGNRAWDAAGDID